MTVSFDALPAFDGRPTDTPPRPQRDKQNKCIGDDTKAAARQSLNCIKNKKKYDEKRFSVWRMEFLHPAMWHDHDIDFARRLHPAMWHVALES